MGLLSRAAGGANRFLRGATTNAAETGGGLRGGMSSLREDPEMLMQGIRQLQATAGDDAAEEALLRLRDVYGHSAAMQAAERIVRPERMGKFMRRLRPPTLTLDADNYPAEAYDTMLTGALGSIPAGLGIGIGAGAIHNATRGRK